MKTKILVAGFACLSLIAAAQQSDKKKDEPVTHEVKAPRDAATGQASGRKMNQTEDQASPDTARDASSGMATGKKSAQDDWQAQSTTTNGDQSAVRESPSKASLGKRESPTKASTGQTQVRTGDVDGDGKADQAAASDVKSPRDAATGQASGKRQHGTIKVVKEVEAPSAPKK